MSNNSELNRLYRELNNILNAEARGGAAARTANNVRRQIGGRPRPRRGRTASYGEPPPRKRSRRGKEYPGQTVPFNHGAPANSNQNNLVAARKNLERLYNQHMDEVDRLRELELQARGNAARKRREARRVRGPNTMRLRENANKNIARARNLKKQADGARASAQAVGHQMHNILQTRRRAIAAKPPSPARTVTPPISWRRKNMERKMEAGVLGPYTHAWYGEQLRNRGAKKLRSPHRNTSWRSRLPAGRESSVRSERNANSNSNESVGNKKSPKRKR